MKIQFIQNVIDKVRDKIWGRKFIREKFVFHESCAWGEYMLTHNMPQVVADLRKGLDESSNALLDLIFNRLIIFPDSGLYNYKIRKSYLSSPQFQTQEEKNDAKLYEREKPAYLKEFELNYKKRYAEAFKLGGTFFAEVVVEAPTFLYHSGLRNKSEKLKNYIAGKDFIDGGAYIGDTALVYIKKYNPAKVYSFEISAKTCAEYENIMKMNNIPKDKYELVQMGLSDSAREIMINDSALAQTNIYNGGTSKVLLTDLDTFSSARNLKTGFIKTDLQGAGLSALLGMAETIKRDRPVLALSIYHNAEEFFEIKPSLDKITEGLDYKMIIEKHYPWPNRMAEIMLFAYPKELDTKD